MNLKLEPLNRRLELVQQSGPRTLLFDVSAYLETMGRAVDLKRLARDLVDQYRADHGPLQRLQAELSAEIQAARTHLGEMLAAHSIADAFLERRLEELGRPPEESPVSFAETLPRSDATLREIIAHIRQRYPQVSLQSYIVPAGAAGYRIRSLERMHDYFAEREHLEILREAGLWGSVSQLLGVLASVRPFLRERMEWYDEPAWRLIREMKERDQPSPADETDDGGKGHYLSVVNRLDVLVIRQCLLRLHVWATEDTALKARDDAPAPLFPSEAAQPGVGAVPFEAVAAPPNPASSSLPELPVEEAEIAETEPILEAVEAAGDPGGDDLPVLPVARPIPFLMQHFSAQRSTLSTEEDEPGVMDASLLVEEID